MSNISSSAVIHPSAIVEDHVSIGERTKVWHGAHLRKGAHLGTDCIVGKGVFIDTEVEIGNAVKIQNNVSVFHGVVVKDGVFVGPHVCFTNDLYPRAVNPDMSLKSTADWALSATIIHRGASLGANATILCGIEVGEWALVAAGSVVTKSVPPFALVRGNPACVVGVVGRSGRILSRSYSPGIFHDPPADPTNQQSAEYSPIEILPEWCP